MTAHATLFSLGQLKPNQILLIHAAGSGIACFAIQMASYIGAKVITTVSSKEKIEKATLLGPISIINYLKHDFAKLIGEQSLDLIVDFIGGDYFPNHLKLLKEKGKLVQIACMKGRFVECDLATIMRKRLNLIGFVLRPQTVAEKGRLWKEAQKQWASALINRELVPIIDSVFNFNDIEQAHERMQSNAHFGKIVIQLD